MTDEVRRLLRSELRQVLIEAPAGCGKTHEAALLAMDAVCDLDDGQRILLLAHTNAAKEEFTRRTRIARSRIEVSTIDSFSVRLLRHYASAFGLPSPLDRNIGPRGEGVPFPRLARDAVQLLDRAPTIARLVSAKYPLIIGDEHQDASANQHSLLMRMSEAGGGRVRFFGDPMQAIFEDDEAVSWTDITDQVDASAMLDSPQRWRMSEETQQLGNWILEARAALSGGQPLPLETAPDSVTVAACDRTRGDAFPQRDARTISRHIWPFVNASGDDSLSILTYSNDAVYTIESAAHSAGIRVNEGADYDATYRLLDSVIEADCEPAAVCRLLLDHIRKSSVGIRQADYDRLLRTFGPDNIVNAPRGRLAPFGGVFAPIYGPATLVGVFDACRQIHGVNVSDFRLQRRLALRLLGSLTKNNGADAADELSAVIAARKAVSSKPTRTASTIHKAKGLEFGHVLIAFCGSRHFPNNEITRRLLYVAISRAVKGLTLHVPIDSPSPLVGEL